MLEDTGGEKKRRGKREGQGIGMKKEEEEEEEVKKNGEERGEGGG